MTVVETILERLESTGDDRAEWAMVVLAALEDEAALNAYLDGREAPAAREEGQREVEPAAAEPPGIYVSSITVEGFRGIGPAATLRLHPGPGLTLVVGRNGSGKSSFAEGLEVLLTGRNYRWEKRTKAWVEGWRNLHHGTASLCAEVLVEGQGPATLTRTWSGDEVGDSTALVRVNSQPARALGDLGWGDALTTFRPFLSYNELGSLLEEGPSKLYDALSSVLGLEQLTAVQQRLHAAWKARQDLQKAVASQAADVVTSLEALDEGHADPRPAAALRALRAKPWDLTTLTTLATGADEAGAAEVELLHRVESLVAPDPSAVADLVARLRDAELACRSFAGTDAQRSRERARLLEQALDFHARHAPASCPVCGADGAMTGAWREASEEEVRRLKQEAAACEAADAALQGVMREAARHVSPPPQVLAQAAALPLDSLAEVRRLWAAWGAARDLAEATALADILEAHVLELAEAVATLVAEARLEAARREDTWRPMRQRLADWLPEARTAVEAALKLPLIKKAEDWWKVASEAIRNERFRPIADRAIAVWQQLRLQSNVDLGGVDLEGTAQRRRVTLRVTVDGTDAEALGVMSQGELHSLALSLFLPRATLAESPFRFVSVDDPVQSMDPSRVEGLARALADTARTRQVIVFTHDDRLPEAVRRLGIPATIVGVTRRAKSAVEVRTLAAPVEGYLDDARALVLTDGLPRDVMARVVPGFCRSALEASCMDVIRRRRLARGQRHEDVEDLLVANARLYPLMALALFDDERQTADVLKRVSQRFGPKAADAFKACNAGAHEAYDGDVEDLVGAVHHLTRQLAEVVS